MEEVVATLAGSGQQRRDDGRDVGAKLGAEAASDLAMDDRGAEILLGGVVRGWDVRAVEEDEQAGPVLLIACLEAAGIGGIGLLGQEGAKDEAVDGVLDAASASGERVGRQSVTDAMEMDGPAKQVAQFDGPDPPRVAIGVDGVGQVADLVRQTDLVGVGVDLKLGAP